MALSDKDLEQVKTIRDIITEPLSRRFNNLENRLDRMENKLDEHIKDSSKQQVSIGYLKGYLVVASSVVAAIAAKAFGLF